MAKNTKVKEKLTSCIISLGLLMAKYASKISKIFSSVYFPVRNYLTTHKLIARFLSHGGLHVVILVALVTLIVSFYSIVKSIQHLKMNIYT